MKVFENIISKINEKIEHYDSRHKILTDAGMFSDADRIADRMSELDFAREIVKQAAAEYNNGWIPCSERLPEYGEVVMCSCTNNGITISCITHKGVKPSKSVRFGQHSVIAWQPLPQPYTK